MWPIVSGLGSNLIVVASFAITWWRHQRKHFPRYWPFVREINRSLVNSLQKCQWREALMFSLICAWIHGWENNREASDLRHHRAHSHVTEMTSCTVCELFLPTLSTHPGNITSASHARSNYTHWNGCKTMVTLKKALSKWEYLCRQNQSSKKRVANYNYDIDFLSTIFVSFSDSISVYNFLWSGILNGWYPKKRCGNVPNSQSVLLGIRIWISHTSVLSLGTVTIGTIICRRFVHIHRHHITVLYNRYVALKKKPS